MRLATPPSGEVGAEVVPVPAWRRRLGGVAAIRDYGIVVVLGALVAVFSLGSEVFLTGANFASVVDQAVAVGLLACAGTLVIVAGGFDLSAGAIFAVSAIVSAKVANSTGVAAGVLAGLGVGLALGAVNGVLCTVGRVNDFVGTLATSIAFAGLAKAISGGDLILVTDPGFADIAGTSILGIKSSTWIFVAFAVLCAFVLNRTVFGRHIFATGGNAAAARLSGIATQRTRALTYVLSGGAAGLAGMIVVARTLSVNASTGTGLIFQAIAAILVGGISVMGGEGAIWRALVGVAILAVIANGFNLNGIDPLYQDIVTGLIIVLAVSADAWVRRRRT